MPIAAPVLMLPSSWVKDEGFRCPDPAPVVQLHAATGPASQLELLMRVDYMSTTQSVVLYHV